MGAKKEKTTVLAVFGISGDLAGRYLLPALSQINKNSQLPDNFKLLGISRRKLSKKGLLRSKTRNLSPMLELFQMDMEKPAEYKRLKAKLNGSSIIFYLALPPDAVLDTIAHLGKAGLNGKTVKLLLEKPFGTDLASAQRVINQTNKYYSEDQIYRIDHYLAKEVAQNIAVFLGTNALFRSVWNSNFIDKIQIIAAESIGIEGREVFYEQTGALKDVVQSHLMQLAALTLMEPCNDVYDLEELALKRRQALDSIESITGKTLKKTFRAQYAGYKQEVKSRSSKTETFVKVELQSNNPRWAGVPIKLATGKNLNDKLTEIRVYFKKSSKTQTNRLILRIQPREGLELDLWIKEPGYERKLQNLPLRFSYQQHFKRLPDAYEQVLVDVIRGPHGLFASSQEVLASWRILQPVLDYWHKDAPNIRTYKKGLTVEDVLSAE